MWLSGKRYIRRQSKRSPIQYGPVGKRSKPSALQAENRSSILRRVTILKTDIAIYLLKTFNLGLKVVFCKPSCFYANRAGGTAPEFVAQGLIKFDS